MLKSEFAYELIENGFSVACTASILKECMDANDQKELYSGIEAHFMECMHYYDLLENAMHEKKISESVFFKELRTILAVIEQGAYKLLIDSAATFFNSAELRSLNELLCKDSDHRQIIEDQVYKFVKDNMEAKS